MFDIYQNIEAKKVAERYINSCKTFLHVKTMQRYLDIYKEKMEDFVGYHILQGLLDRKLEQIENGKA